MSDREQDSAQPVAGSEPIDGNEVSHHLEVVRAVLGCDRPEERRRLLAEGMSRFGPRFCATIGYLRSNREQAGDPAFRDALAGLERESIEVVTDWLSGTAILGSVDETERRARFAAAAMADGRAGLERLAAAVVLQLPRGHPARDQDAARQSLLASLERARREDEAEGLVLTIGNLLEHNLVDEPAAQALVVEGEAALDRVDPVDFGRRFLIQCLGFFVRLALEPPAGTAPEATRAWLARAEELHRRAAAIGGEEAILAKNQTLLGLLHSSMGNTQAAAAAFRAARLSGRLEPGELRTPALIEARLWFSMGQLEEVVALLEPAVESFEEVYLTAVEESAIEDAGGELAEITGNLAFAHAELGAWGAAARALEHGKSLRLRHQAALRRHPAAARLLAIERELHALARGIRPASAASRQDRERDRLGAQITLQSKVLEEYRRQRPSLPRELIASPTVAEIAAQLEPGQAVVLLGLASSRIHRGSMVIVILPQDRDEPSAGLLLERLTVKRLAEIYLGDNQDGWALALEVADEARIDPRPALDALIELLDAELGRPLAAALAGRGVSRLHLVPHRFYELAPLWALPSLADFEMVIAPSAAHFVAAAAGTGRTVDTATLVGDPTLDLPLSPIEIAAASRRLRAAGVATTELTGDEADEQSVARAAAGAGIFHFCGHGRAELTDPFRSALLLQPRWQAAGLDGPEALARLAAGVETWTEVDDQRRAARLSDDAYLVEYRNPDSGELERFYEHGEEGTLWGRWAGDVCLQHAELWTAGDLAVSHSLERCELAFLSACTSSAGGIREREERGGLPGALQLAGVDTIIATLWPVSDVLTVLFVDLFYEGLAAGGGSPDLARLVRQAGRALGRMERDEALERLRSLRAGLEDIAAIFELDSALVTLQQADERPFRHPYAWASFHLLGRGELKLRAGGRRPEESLP